MGNCCGKESTGSGGGHIVGGGNNFKGQGRTLGDAPPRPAAAPAGGSNTAAKASVPIVATSGPGRTLGSGEEGGDARTAAAAAAEARAAKTGPKDVLSQKLADQKKGGMQGALQEASEENRRHREIEQAAQDRNWS